MDSEQAFLKSVALCVREFVTGVRKPRGCCCSDKQIIDEQLPKALNSICIHFVSSVMKVLVGEQETEKFISQGDPMGKVKTHKPWLQIITDLLKEMKSDGLIEFCE
ncbi:MAG: hypothetical protein GY739_09540, partial [Mesoflavibacter sp.]|nr:hypothetical protein [Mesoflavibacter sp.]